MKKWWLVWGLVFLVNAQMVTANGVSINPPFTDITIDKNIAQKSVMVEIGNQTFGELTMELTVVDFGSLDESGGVAFLTTNKDKTERKYALASWISLEKDKIVVAPNKTEKIKVMILNKNSLSPGGHYGAVLATVKSGGNNISETVGFNQSMASLFYIQKTGGEIRKLDLRRTEYKQNWLQMPALVNLKFENSGNVHVVPRGKVEIKNSGGEVVAKGIINDGSVKILPESFRMMMVGLKETDWWQWPGKYEMTISFRYDGKDELLITKSQFIYVGKEGLILGAGGGLFLMGIYLIIRRKNRK